MNDLKKIRCLIGFVIFGLIISGVTAFPLLIELNLMSEWIVGKSGNLNPSDYEGYKHWILLVREGLDNTHKQYPFIAYGTDWLAFAHIIIALFFIPVYRKPAQYIEILYVGVIACITVIPLALICGEVRGIPFYWRLIDCSFGFVAIFPLLYGIKLIRRLEVKD
ncbi:MAG: hypothetical protein HRT88_03665 [Lentisphaeraceae bacterium]|nr:hypothetical protein [Lentisphaeraceae bacterium]